ncbi:MAG TPA: thioredoxin domain-containing protein [Motilibacterales bacterium]|nr:thioredoxin domain-containing protein [Motilibacterales bacterium]
MANHLAGSLSPYLRQHADNPVDWWPWCDEAFAEARRRDVPILLSVGYSACHWCHVMAHESFEDARTAALMNERFVSIKVDREERPDIDAVYMEATQALTGRGGWPMTVFLDHDGRAFLAGTYFPPVGHGGMPSFTDVLRGVDRTWREDRARIGGAAEQLHAALSARGASAFGAGRSATLGDVTEAVDALAAQFDAARGGFGGAPKFPPSMVLEFLLRADVLARSAGQPDPRALGMAARTMQAMARGGMYDQLAGGFARYSVDADWVVPHFEKMLYDNALLLRVHVHWWRATGDPLARRIATQTAQFLIDDLRTPEGGFASALDADSEGREGAHYVWTQRELVAVLGPDEGAWVADLCEVTPRGTFERGASVLQLRSDPDDPGRWAAARASLFSARLQRERPARDDKVVTAWNGLAIAALAEAGALLDEPEWIAAAVACAELLVALHQDPDTGRLLRTSLGGQANASAPAVLEDHADLAEGLLALYQVTGDERWFATAHALLDVVLEQFTDGDGGFFDTAVDAPGLVRRPRDPSDGVTPSGASAAAHALLTLGALTGESRYLAAADAALEALVPIAVASPRFAGWTWSTIAARLAGPFQVAIVVPRGAPAAAGTAASALRGIALSSNSPGLVVAVGEEGVATVPLLAQRPAIAGQPTAYPCRGFVCDLPVTDPEALRGALGG